MNELLTNPLFQSALLPLAVAFVACWVLLPLGRTWAGLGFATAYGASVYFTMGFQFFPLTSTRKIIILGGIAIVLGILIDLYKGPRRPVPVIVAALGAAAAVWVVWPVLQRQEGSEFWLMLLPVFYSAWLIAGFEGLRHETARATTAAVALGIGTGVSAVLGASALLGQLGGAIGAAAGAYVLVLLFKEKLTLGSSFTLPVATLAALIGTAGVVYAGLTGYALIPLALIPLAARIPVKQRWNRFLKIAAVAAYTLPFVIGAIAITWQVSQAAEPSLY